MANMPCKKWKFESDAGEILEYVSDVHVGVDGRFSVSIPDEFSDVSEKMNPNFFEVEGVYKNRGNKVRVYGPNLDKIYSFIGKIAKEYFTCEVKREQVIAYGAVAKVAFWKDDDGDFYPNGSFASSGCWAKIDTLDATHPADFYSIGVAAKVLWKVTTSRASSVKITYEYPMEFHQDKKSAGARLNGFCGLTIGDPRYGRIKEMPYSDEAAVFFYDMMMAMCKMAEKLEHFIENRELVMRAIDQRINGARLITGEI